MTALVHPTRAPFPDNMGLKVSAFRVANPEEGDKQFDLQSVTDAQKKV